MSFPPPPAAAPSGFNSNGSKGRLPARRKSLPRPVSQPQATQTCSAEQLQPHKPSGTAWRTCDGLRQR